MKLLLAFMVNSKNLPSFCPLSFSSKKHIPPIYQYSTGLVKPNPFSLPEPNPQRTLVPPCGSDVIKRLVSSGEANREVLLNTSHLVGAGFLRPDNVVN